MVADYLSYLDTTGYAVVLEWIKEKTYGNILMLEIGTKDVFEITCSLCDILNKEIPLHINACLEIDLFKKLIELSNLDIKQKGCIGYKTPFFKW